MFRPESIDIRLDSGLSLPASAVNALRREALDSLSVPYRAAGAAGASCPAAAGR